MYIILLGGSPARDVILEQSEQILASESPRGSLFRLRASLRMLVLSHQVRESHLIIKFTLRLPRGEPQDVFATDTGDGHCMC